MGVTSAGSRNGPGSARKRHNAGGGASSDTPWSREAASPVQALRGQPEDGGQAEESEGGNRSESGRGFVAPAPLPRCSGVTSQALTSGVQAACTASGPARSGVLALPAASQNITQVDRTRVWEPPQQSAGRIAIRRRPTHWQRSCAACERMRLFGFMKSTLML